MYTSDNQYMTDKGISGTEILGVLSGMDEGLYNIFKEYDYSEEEKERYRLGEELIKAVKEDNIKEVERLLEVGVDINNQDKYGMTALMYALGYGIGYGNRAIVDKLLEVERIGVDIIDNNGKTALMIASLHGEIDVVDKLISKGAEVNIQAKNGITALMIASMYGEIDVVDKLISKGADVHIKDNNGNTALMLASSSGNKDIVELLKSHVREKKVNR